MVLIAGVNLGVFLQGIYEFIPQNYARAETRVDYYEDINLINDFTRARETHQFYVNHPEFCNGWTGDIKQNAEWIDVYDLVIFKLKEKWGI